MRKLAILATALLASTAAASTRSIREWADAYASPRLAGAGTDATGRKIVHGHLELSLASGRLYTVMAGDVPAGTFFAGKGSFRYVSTDPVEAATYRFNVKEASDYEVDAQGGFGDTLESALLFASGAPEEASVPTLEGEPDAAAAALFARHLADWRGAKGWRYEELMPQGALDPPQEPVQHIEIDAARHPVVYTRDTLRDDEELIGVMRPVKSQLKFLADWKVPEYLSVRPIRRARLEPRARRFRLVDVDLTLVNPSGIRAELTVRETFEALQPVRVLDLALPSRLIGSVGATASLKENPYTVSSIADAQGAPLPFVQVGDTLLVELARPLKAKERVELVVTVAGDVLFRPGADSYWMLGERWLPLPASLAMQAFAYRAVIKVQKPFVAFSAGRTEKRWEEGDLACAEFRETKPIQLPWILAGKYTTHSETKGDLTVRVSTYAMTKEREMKQIASLCFSFIEFYKPLLGDFPWSELNVLEINSYGFGIAPPGMIFITREAFTKTPLDEEANVYVVGINQRLAHEVAHAWWGHVSMLGDPEDQWMSESTAQIYSAHAMGMKSKEDFERELRAWRAGAKEVGSKGTVYLANQMAGEDRSADRFNLLYNKGALVLHALREEVGDQTFFTILKSYLRSFPYQPATTKELIGITSFITKKDYRPFFDRYLLGTEIPEAKKK